MNDEIVKMVREESLIIIDKDVIYKTIKDGSYGENYNIMTGYYNVCTDSLTYMKASCNTHGRVRNIIGSFMYEDVTLFDSGIYHHNWFTNAPCESSFIFNHTVGHYGNTYLISHAQFDDKILMITTQNYCKTNDIYVYDISCKRMYKSSMCIDKNAHDIRCYKSFDVIYVRIDSEKYAINICDITYDDYKSNVSFTMTKDLPQTHVCNSKYIIKQENRIITVFNSKNKYITSFKKPILLEIFNISDMKILHGHVLLISTDGFNYKYYVKLKNRIAHKSTRLSKRIKDELFDRAVAAQEWC